jgi:hypothetical protein
MNRRKFLGVTAASATALVAGCDPCDCNDTLCDLPEYEFKCYVDRTELSLDPLYDIVVIEDKVLNWAKTGYITSTWRGYIPKSNLFPITRDEWLSEGKYDALAMDMWNVRDKEWERDWLEWRKIRGYNFCLGELEFEPVC